MSSTPNDPVPSSRPPGGWPPDAHTQPLPPYGQEGQPGSTPPPGYGPQSGSSPQPGYGPPAGSTPQPGYGPPAGATPPPGYGLPGGYVPPTGSTPPAYPAAYGSPQPPRAPLEPKRSRRTGWVVAAALLAGVGGGVGGAAGYDYLDEPDTTIAAGAPSTSTPEVSLPVGARAKRSASIEAVAQVVLPSVVKIDEIASTGSEAAPLSRSIGSGSGIILTSDGLILTNNHVVSLSADNSRLVVSFNDGTTAPAEIVGRDPLTDIAVIQAEDVSGLTPARLGRSSDLSVGEQVVAIGSPFGLESTVTSGIVSALGRPVSTGSQTSQTDSSTFPAIQTDASINPGNSGGPLVNPAGEVVGINSAIRTTGSTSGEAGSIGLGFAIPIDEARPIVQQLRSGETPTHARIGIEVFDALVNGLAGG
ncbi:MAG TPA: trypsin-like peptidase domain-containing protein, partial [Nocardioidaceae bacterium]|nr:trypsin-like peptidase domain-containing protein [Nocardioidaceae bacterium]